MYNDKPEKKNQGEGKRRKKNKKKKKRNKKKEQKAPVEEKVINPEEEDLEEIKLPESKEEEKSSSPARIQNFFEKKESSGSLQEIVEDAAIEKWQKNDTASNKNVLSASEDSSTSERYQIRSRLQQKPQVKIRSPAESDSKSKPVKAEFIDPLRGILTSDSDMDHINMMDH